MAGVRMSMSKIREVLRLTHELGLSVRQECDRRLEPFLGAQILGDRDVDVLGPGDEIEKELVLDECHRQLDAINEAMDAAVRRGQFVRGRVIDLSPAAARAIGGGDLTQVSLRVGG
jgi:hypothetical protein